MMQEGVTVNEASPELQAWFNEIGDKMAEEFAQKDPWAKKILNSQKEFVEKYKKYQGRLAPYFRD
jgi:TRAP-type mannitol/chloroaromatic compound transport system substrate-binding protein